MANSLNIAVIGGGINGLCTAHELIAAGHRVTLFERAQLMGATSSHSSKLLHGGLRYLETGEYRLVREALIERAWWLEACPRHAQPMRIALPVYKGLSRSPLLIGCGLILYQLLAGSRQIGGWNWRNAARFAEENPELRNAGLRGGFYFYDGQMDDRALGLWIAERARERGVTILENHEVTRIDTAGSVEVGDQHYEFDRIVNVTGPWAELLLKQSGIASHHGIAWVRGSHIVFDEPCRQAMLLQVPGENRIFFVLPLRGRTMVGTTDAAQSTADPIAPSAAEVDYLLNAYNHYFRDTRDQHHIVDRFAGVRPLLQFKGDPSKASREYVLDRKSRLISVYGGKWTTARALGRRVLRLIETTAESI